MTQETKTEDQEIIAISLVYAALKDLEPDARGRVLNYVTSKFGISKHVSTASIDREHISYPHSHSRQSVDTSTVSEDDLDGISPAGKKWITRSGIKSEKLMLIFSLGIDEIDLVSKSVPGNTKSQRMKNVFLLKGIAAYLSTGSARITHDQIKETCLHYDAWDAGNFSRFFKSMSADVSGGKDGYTLTAKGISEATSLVKKMLGES